MLHEQLGKGQAVLVRKTEAAGPPAPSPTAFQIQNILGEVEEVGACRPTPLLCPSRWAVRRMEGAGDRQGLGKAAPRSSGMTPCPQPAYPAPRD